MMEKENVEERLSELLTEGNLSGKDPEKEAPRRLSPRYEVRVEAEHEPVLEETKQYRRIAKEIDGRYDKYLPREDS